MFKKILLCGFTALLLCLTGCVSGSAYASVADIKQKMSEKHPVVNVLTPYTGDVFFVNTGKITLRVLCFIPTLGISEILIGRPCRYVIADFKARNRLRVNDENQKYYARERERKEELIRQALDPLLGGSKADLITAIGPPTRTFPDGLGGEIYIYEQQSISGSTASAWTLSYKGISGTTYNQGPSKIILKQKLFFFDKSGKLYKWELR